MKIVILSTCDEWKSWASMKKYWIGNSNQAGMRKLYKVIRKGIEDGTFTFKNGSKEEQLELFDETIETQCDVAKWDILKKSLEYGYLELLELNAYC